MVVKPGVQGMVPFPQDDRLKNEVERLRTELSMLILERDELLYVECRNLEMRYLLLFGEQAYRIYQLECLILREKRRVAMIRAKKNRQEKVDLTEIDALLDSELAQWVEQLQQRLEKIRAAYEWLTLRPMTEEETQEIKRLYRAIVKALHPDLNPEAGEEELRLFHRAVSAYKQGNLNEIRLIFEVISKKRPLEALGNEQEALKAEKEKLELMIARVRRDMDRIRHSFPYTEKELLEDEEQIQARLEILNQRIRDLEEILEAWQKETLESMR